MSKAELLTLITQGFIASKSNVDEKNDSNKILIGSERTTLGREGSDYSAAIFADLFNANEVILFKDVDGVYDTDPKKNPNAKLLSTLTYDQAFNLCSSGNMVIHPKTINHLKKKQIPLSIKNFSTPTKLGTLIN